MQPVKIKVLVEISISGTDLKPGHYEGFELIEHEGPFWNRKTRKRYLIDTRKSQEKEFGFSLGMGPDVTKFFADGKVTIELVSQASFARSDQSEP